MTRSPAHNALVISYAAVAWSAVSGVLSVAVGIAAASTALLGTGTDVLADLTSSVVLIGRFRSEVRASASTAAAERRAERIAALALILVAIGIAATAITRLARHEPASVTGFGIALAVAPVVVLPVFAVFKYRIAAAVPSPALRMDGHITLVGATMAALTLAGLVTTSGLGWKWADPAAAIMVAGAAAAVGTATLYASREGPGTEQA